ncbi:hypothetical protein [Caulobacter sp. DWP3-1-3b2]|uniref:hypothetical protein n=1 Tax=Caulobacter sp. DWP3-1-3b2 TaxID=2804643 RepID=UPI003CED70C6
MGRHEPPCAMFAAPLSVEQRIEREIEFIAGVSVDVRDLPRQRLAELADENEGVASGYLSAAQLVDGSQRLTFLWMGGHHAMRAQVYAEAARAT